MTHNNHSKHIKKPKNNKNTINLQKCISYQLHTGVKVHRQQCSSSENNVHLRTFILETKLTRTLNYEYFNQFLSKTKLNKSVITILVLISLSNLTKM